MGPGARDDLACRRVGPRRSAAAAGGRSFAVEVGRTRVAVHGTSFTVSREGDRVTVEVAHGSVAVGPDWSPGLDAGVAPRRPRSGDVLARRGEGSALARRARKRTGSRRRPRLPGRSPVEGDGAARRGRRRSRRRRPREAARRRPRRIGGAHHRRRERKACPPASRGRASALAVTRVEQDEAAAKRHLERHRELLRAPRQLARRDVLDPELAHAFDFAERHGSRGRYSALRFRPS